MGEREKPPKPPRGMFKCEERKPPKPPRGMFNCEERKPPKPPRGMFKCEERKPPSPRGGCFIERGGKTIFSSHLPTHMWNDFLFTLQI
jgi:hypothetical protein